MAAFKFAEFELDIERRILSRNAEVVKIGARAFDILACLVGQAGQVVSKDALLKAVWPSTHVDDVALRVHMVALRKAISTDGTGSCIESVAGRGYQFVRQVARLDRGRSGDHSGARARSILPAALEEIIGREGFLHEAVELLGTASLVTIVGPGGIGKTTVAIELARRIEDAYERTILLDLGSLSSGAQVGPLLSTRLGHVAYSSDPLPGIIQTLAEQRTLLIFDNCEHLIDECASMVERLLGSLTNLTIIATSRETLRVRSEHVRVLQGLASPEAGQAVSDARGYSAVELFLRRFYAANGNLADTDEQELSLAAGIVARLDGIPLAIELAAARAASLGIRTVAESLNDPISLLKRGKRTAPQRQQTLRATLEWSFSLLSEIERRLLEYLSVFAGPFDGASALEVASDWLVGHDFEDALAGLSAKSLISVSREQGTLRLLEVTRAFAREELENRGALCDALTAHAEWVEARLVAATRDWATLSTPRWLASYGQLINDVRSALNWSFDSGQSDRALKLVAMSHIIWTQMGLAGEQLAILQRAVSIMDGSIALEPIAEARLRASYAAVLFHLKSITADEEAIRQFRKATLAAEATGDQIEIARAHTGICAILTTHGRYQEAMDVAARLEDKFGTIGNNAVSRVFAMNLHYLGRFDESEDMCHRALDAGSANVRSTRTSGAGYDQRLLAMLVMAKNAWVQGDTDAALSHSREVVAEALNMGDPISTCLVLAVSSCVIYFGMGEVDAARHHLDILREVSTRHSLARWLEWYKGYELLLLESGATAADFERSFSESIPGPRVESMVVAAGTRVGSRVVDLALSADAGWCRPELLRVRGELLKSRDTSQAERLFKASYDLAVKQGASLWQLRAAVSLFNSKPSRTENDSIELVLCALGNFKGKLALAEQRLLKDSGLSNLVSLSGTVSTPSLEPNYSRMPTLECAL